MSETNVSHALLISDARGSRKLLLDGLKYTIGRDVNNNIQLYSRFVSRQHAILLRVPGTEHGRYLYRIVDGDLSGKPSVNGVIINNHTKVSSYELCDGDTITLAPNVQLTYLMDVVTGAKESAKTASSEHTGA
ncbi:FHA domain-containing protein [Tumidithrix helvetica PCC 7403]|uniref:FHA domain-containing protein n=1 Tax=Tumidithrix helvetica TaxID=3457545 RepID=UPI003CA327A1